MTNTMNLQSGPTLVSVEQLRRGGPSRFTVETLDFKATLIQRSWSEGRREMNKTSRVFDALAAFNGGKDWDARETELVVDAIRREQDGTLEGKCPVLARYHRDAMRVARAGIDAALLVLVEALEAAGHRVSAADAAVARFSINAGCSMCPCSPGFVLNFRVTVDGTPVDIYLR